MSVAGCMVVRNEADGIEAAAKSLLPLVDELVVLDTGSTDGTLEWLLRFAEQHPFVRVHQEPWCDDFSLARNRMHEFTQAEWIVVLDGDEVLLDAGNLFGLLSETDADAVLVRVRAIHALGRVEVIHFPKAYRRQRCVWKYPVHNQLIYSGPTATSTATIRADYKTGIGSTLSRTPILEAYYRDHPLDPHAPFFLARTAASTGDWPAVRRWCEVLRRVAPSSVAHSAFWYYLALATWMLDGMAASDVVVRDGLAHHPEHPDLWHLRLNAALVRWSFAAAHWPLDLLCESREAAVDRAAFREAQRLLDLPFRVGT